MFEIIEENIRKVSKFDFFSLDLKPAAFFSPSRSLLKLVHKLSRLMASIKNMEKDNVIASRLWLKNLDILKANRDQIIVHLFDSLSPSFSLLR